MLIDMTNPEHVAMFEREEHAVVLDGEVLLEITKDNDGNVTGYVTASQERCDEMRKATPAQRAAEGWDRHQAILDALPAVLPKLVR